MSFSACITGVKSNKDDRRDNIIGARKTPNAKQPNSRPPAGLRDKVGFLYGTLPNYSGPYGVWASHNYYPAEWLQG